MVFVRLTEKGLANDVRVVLPHPQLSGFMITEIDSRLLRWVALLSMLSALHVQPLAAASNERRYVVKPHDTLTEIARKHGVTVAALMAHNRLTQPNKIAAGKILRIPDPKAGIARPVLDSDLRMKLDRVRVAPRKWKYIVIHHSATDSGTVAGMDRYHREQRHMENGLAYHFVIGNGHGMADGEITIGKRWIEQLDGGHLASASLNARSIGVCLVGNFDEDIPTEKQMSGLQSLVKYLLAHSRLTLSAVKTHQQINPIHTRCPGVRFPAETFIDELRRK